MKRRTLTLTLCILACIALIGVGFASWVITYEQNAEANGNVEVDTIDDKSHIVTIINGESQSVVFGSKKSSENAWLVSNEDKENLVLTYKVSVTNYSDLDTTTPLKVTLEETSQSNAYAAAVTANYVAAIPTQEANKISVTPDGEGNGNYIVTITFNWGSYFNGENPTVFYNSKNPTEEKSDGISYMQDALNVLNDADGVYKKLDKATFKITIAPNKAE